MIHGLIVEIQRMRIQSFTVYTELRKECQMISPMRARTIYTSSAAKHHHNPYPCRQIAPRLNITTKRYHHTRSPSSNATYHAIPHSVFLTKLRWFTKLRWCVKLRCQRRAWHLGGFPTLENHQVHIPCLGPRWNESLRLSSWSILPNPNHGSP